VARAAPFVDGAEDLLVGERYKAALSHVFLKSLETLKRAPVTIECARPLRFEACYRIIVACHYDLLTV
jgi:hypothetical protein